MSEHRIIKADYANWRPVAGRKVLQLVLEVPIEQTADVMEKLGVPMPGESKWVAVALLNSPVVQTVGNASDAKPKPVVERRDDAGASPARADKRKFSELPLSQQAALKCGDERFRKFLGVVSEQYAAGFVRKRCDIASRSELDIIGNMAAREAWFGILDEYDVWLTTQQYQESVRA